MEPSPDIVYICRDGKNEELRYSLRSLTNIPHGNVWVFGGAPTWLSDAAVHVSLRQAGSKYDNAKLNTIAAAHPN